MSKKVKVFGVNSLSLIQVPTPNLQQVLMHPDFNSPVCSRALKVTDKELVSSFRMLRGPINILNSAPIKKRRSIALQLSSINTLELV